MAFNATAYDSINIALIVLCILFHCLGLALLLKLWKRNSQHLMIINLSAAELITSILRLLIISCAQELPPMPTRPCSPTSNRNGTAGGIRGAGNRNNINGTTVNNTGLAGGNRNGRVGFMGFPQLSSYQEKLSDTLQYSNILAMTGMFFVIFLIMIALMLDRMLVVVLKEKYHQICSIRNTSIAMAFCWVVGVIMMIVFPLVRHYDGYKHHYHFEYHIYTVCDVVFMVVAIVSYFAVLALYSGYQVQEDQLDEEGNAVDKTAKAEEVPTSWSIVRTLRMPHFYIPLLILLTYFIFVVLPHWIYLGEKYPEGECPGSPDPYRAMLQLLIIGYISDAVVYILLLPSVRTLLAQWLGCGSKSSYESRPAKGVDNSAVEMT